MLRTARALLRASHGYDAVKMLCLAFSVDLAEAVGQLQALRTVRAAAGPVLLMAGVEAVLQVGGPRAGGE